jgi:hypothetical protein
MRLADKTALITGGNSGIGHCAFVPCRGCAGRHHRTQQDGAGCPGFRASKGIIRTADSFAMVTLIETPPTRGRRLAFKFRSSSTPRSGSPGIPRGNERRR